MWVYRICGTCEFIGYVEHAVLQDVWNMWFYRICGTCGFIGYEGHVVL